MNADARVRLDQMKHSCLNLLIIWEITSTRVGRTVF